MQTSIRNYALLVSHAGGWKILMCDNKKTLNSMQHNIRIHYPHLCSWVVDPDDYTEPRFVLPKGEKVVSFIKRILT